MPNSVSDALFIYCGGVGRTRGGGWRSDQIGIFVVFQWTHSFTPPFPSCCPHCHHCRRRIYSNIFEYLHRRIYSYSYSVDIFKPNIFVFVFGFYFWVEYIRIRFLFLSRIYSYSYSVFIFETNIFVFVFGGQNTIRSPLAQPNHAFIYFYGLPQLLIHIQPTPIFFGIISI